jgi:hypothetical protein
MLQHYNTKHKMTMTPKKGNWWVHSSEKDDNGGTLNFIIIVVAHNTKWPWIKDDHVIGKNDKTMNNEFVHLKNDNKGNKLGFVLASAIL